jgi:hypothetical protein
MSDYWAPLNPSTLQVCCGSERNNLRVFFSGILACCMDFCSRQFGSSWNFPSVVRFWTRSGNARSLYLKRIQYGAKFSKNFFFLKFLIFLLWWSSWVLKLRLATLNFFSLDIYMQADHFTSALIADWYTGLCLPSLLSELCRRCNGPASTNRHRFDP